jgi:hypothetical protein
MSRQKNDSARNADTENIGKLFPALRDKLSHFMPRPGGISLRSYGDWTGRAPMWGLCLLHITGHALNPLKISQFPRFCLVI